MLVRSFLSNILIAEEVSPTWRWSSNHSYPPPYTLPLPGCLCQAQTDPMHQPNKAQVCTVSPKRTNSLYSERNNPNPVPDPKPLDCNEFTSYPIRPSLSPQFAKNFGRDLSHITTQSLLAVPQATNLTKFSPTIPYSTSPPTYPLGIIIAKLIQ